MTSPKELINIIKDLEKAYETRTCIEDYLKAFNEAFDKFEKTDYNNPSKYWYNKEKYNELNKGRSQFLDFMASGKHHLGDFGMEA